MKYIFSISLLIIYLVGVIQPTWILIDFYMHRDDYTQKYCRFLDQGITQCRASCYLDDLLAEQQEENKATQIISTQQQKIYELISLEKIALNHCSGIVRSTSFFYSSSYRFDVVHLIFHPPKA